jgi:hypothetical protein
MFMLSPCLYGTLNAQIGISFTQFTRFTVGTKGAITMVVNKSSQKGLRNGWTRATFILRNDYLEKIKALAYWQRKKVKEVIDEALAAYLKGKKTKPRMNE